MFKAALWKVGSLIPGMGLAIEATQPSFSRFSELPFELRDQIWKYSLSPRIIPLHFHEYSHSTEDDGLETEEVDESEENDDEEGDSIEDEPVPRLPYRLYPREDPRSNKYHNSRGNTVNISFQVVILTCNNKRPCECKFTPPGSASTVIAPPQFFVCHESRNSTRKLYSRYLDSEYNTKGHVFRPFGRFRLAKDCDLDSTPGGTRTKQNSIEAPNPDLYRTGVFMNPSLDILQISAKLGVACNIDQIYNLLAIFAVQIPTLSKIVITPSIFLRPYQFYERERFQLWKNIGGSTRWVSTKVLMFPYLTEVVIVVAGGDRGGMLPKEWRERTAGEWVSALEGMRENWPEKWDGKMPSLRFVNKVNEV